jgi:hypothetical protein
MNLSHAPWFISLLKKNNTANWQIEEIESSQASLYIRSSLKLVDSKQLLVQVMIWVHETASISRLIHFGADGSAITNQVPNSYLLWLLIFKDGESIQQHPDWISIWWTTPNKYQTHQVLCQKKMQLNTSSYTWIFELHLVIKRTSRSHRKQR